MFVAPVQKQFMYTDGYWILRSCSTIQIYGNESNKTNYIHEQLKSMTSTVFWDVMDLCRMTPCYIPEGIQSHRCENLKSKLKADYILEILATI
jgi:hypothetical protein